MKKEDIEIYYYVTYECRFCNKKIFEKDLNKHQKECKE